MKATPKGRDDSHEFEYSKITNNIYIGGDMCKGGICKIHGEEFKVLGVCAEINLSEERNELPPKDIDSYVWLPTTDGYAPSPFQLSLGICVMNTVVTQGKIVYVHCRNGHGRSPTLVAAYFIRFKNMTVDEAQKYIKTKRPEVHLENAQIKALEIFAKKWSK